VPLLSNHCAEYLDTEFSEQRYEKRLRYKDRRGRPAPGPDRVYQAERKYDAAGRLIEITSLDANGRRMIDLYGNASLRYRYDARANEIEATSTTSVGALTAGTDGWAVQRATWDEQGNHTALALFDESGRPTLVQDGWHRRTWERDAQGYVTSLRHCAVDGAPATSDGCQDCRMERDDRGRAVSLDFFGLDGTPVTRRGGYARTAIAWPIVKETAQRRREQLVLVLVLA
jgi:hypothetical protein